MSKWNKEVYGDIFQKLLIREDIVKIKEKLFEEARNAENTNVLHRIQAKYKNYLHFDSVDC